MRKGLVRDCVFCGIVLAFGTSGLFAQPANDICTEAEIVGLVAGLEDPGDEGPWWSYSRFKGSQTCICWLWSKIVPQ